MKIKTKVVFNLEGFVVPSAVTCTVPSDSSFPFVPTPALPAAPPALCSLPLSAFDPETLEAMCGEFRRQVFQKAGKHRPDTVRRKS